MAVKAYGIDRKLRPEQMTKYTVWRRKIIDMIKVRDPLALRPGAYDALLGLLFPELAPVLAASYRRTAPGQENAEES
ncbi:hypothetical protein D3C71_2028810 [compost metagenome]